LRDRELVLHDHVLGGGGVLRTDLVERDAEHVDGAPTVLGRSLMARRIDSFGKVASVVIPFLARSQARFRVWANSLGADLPSTDEGDPGASSRIPV
ncbi:MAG TPA: hypothetical protein VGZ22_29865, partial [Isosphaeraceae bacterium]|nr:hypothetical protein [Isosphaeraceae bacterium]